MGNQCAQDCSSDYCKGSEARFDMDSEHGPCVNQEQALSDYPRLVLGSRNDHRYNAAGPILHAAKHSPASEDCMQSSNTLQLGGPFKRVISHKDGSVQNVHTASTPAPRPPNMEFGNPINESSVHPTQLPEAVVEPERTSESAFDTASEKAPVLEIVFEVNGTSKTLNVYRRPFGAEFTKRRSCPTTITKVHPKSYASELGVEPGWIVQCVAGEDVSNRTFEQTQKAITTGLMVLPFADGKQPPRTQEEEV